MKQSKGNSEEELKKLLQANEEKKKKLTEEFGAHFGEMTDNKGLPPEIESQFLNNIMAFEDAWRNSKQVTLYELLGKPFYVKHEDLTEDGIHDELNRINELLQRHQISLDTLCEVSEGELYRFITEELFQQEVDDMHIPGMITHYTYEEFHPNHEYDIRRHSEDFISSYLNKEDDFYTHLLSGEAEKMDWHIHFRQAFSSFSIVKLEITQVEFDAEKAKVQFYCDFTGDVEGSTESLKFVGNGEVSLILEWDYWCIDTLILPHGKIC